MKVQIPMDDCNLETILATLFLLWVQIPLWTIVTGVAGHELREGAVQIPLWTIVTSLPPRPGAIRQQSSDSSMDDCNTDAELILPVGKRFRFLYGRL